MAIHVGKNSYHITIGQKW